MADHVTVEDRSGTVPEAASRQVYSGPRVSRLSRGRRRCAKRGARIL